MQNTLYYGKGGYMATGRGFGLKHTEFVELYRTYCGTHILLGVEVAFGLLIYYYLSGLHLDLTRNMFVETFPLILVAMSFIYTPFVMNPGAVNSFLIREDWTQFLNWIYTNGGTAQQSWQKWYMEIIKDNAGLNLAHTYTCTLCGGCGGDNGGGVPRAKPGGGQADAPPVLGKRSVRSSSGFSDWLKDDCRSSATGARIGAGSKAMAGGSSDGRMNRDYPPADVALYESPQDRRDGCCKGCCSLWVPYSFGTRVWYVFLPSCRKLLLIACTAHVTFEMSAGGEAFLQSSAPPLMAVILLFLVIYVVDWFLFQSAGYKEKRALMSDEELESGRRRKKPHKPGILQACWRKLVSFFRNYVCFGHCISFMDNSRKHMWRWMRAHSRQLIWLGVSVGVMLAVLMLVARVASPTVLFWLILCLFTTMYWVLHDIYLVLMKSNSKHVREMGVIPSYFVLNFLRTVHMMIGAIIVLPFYVLSSFPFTNQLHNQLLFNDIFAAKADNDYHMNRIISKKGD